MTPQLENGYTMIANEILDALCKFRIPGEQRQCLDYILRKTYGFKKSEDQISNGQFCSATGLKKGNVSRAIKWLSEKQLVIKSDNTKIPTYRFNKDYSEWLLLSKKQPVIKKATVVIKSDNKLLSKVMDTKEKKETIQKKDVEEVFNFWKEELKHQKSKLDSSRERLIRARLKDGYSVADLKEAVTGCKNSPFHQGENKDRKKYDGIELICRDAAHVDMFRKIQPEF